MTRHCIIGCGTYGSYLAKRLAETAAPGDQITVIEIGDETTRDEAETGIAAESHTSRAAQLGRYFGLGGTSARWGGQVLFFDGRDIDGAGAASDAGVQADWQEIVAVNRRFRRTVLQNLLGSADKFDQLLDGGGAVRAGIWMKYSKRNTFKLLGKRHFSTIDLQKNRRVTDLILDGKKIRGLRCRAADGAEKTIEADRFYLTAGAIESCRFLLEMHEKHGIFPQKDLGRHFGDHVSVPLFKVKNHAPRVMEQSLLPVFLEGSLLTKRLVVGDGQGRVGFAHAVLNEDVRVFSSIKKMLFGRQKMDFSLRDILTGVEFLVRFGFSVLFLKKMYAHRNNWTLRLDIEQAFPNENRIALSENRDKYGQKLARLDWQVSPADLVCLENIKNSLAELFQKEGIPFSPVFGEGDRAAKAEDVYHPAGFLRMGLDADAPLDLDCLVRGVDNLWHFSTAMFPSAKSINPTAAGFCFIEKHLEER